MHDSRLEEQLRATLRAEAEAQPLTITLQELERRASLRRRKQVGRRDGLVAAAVIVVAVGSALGLSSGWFGGSSAGIGSSPAANVDTGITQASPMPIPSATACETIDPATLEGPPDLLMGTTQPGAVALGGQRSSYALGDRQFGEEGTWAHDTIGLQPVLAGFGAERLQVLARGPDACLVGLHVDAIPRQQPSDTQIRIAEVTTNPTRVIEFSRPAVGDWFVRVHVDFETASGTTAWAEAFFAIVVPDCAALDGSSADPPAIGLVSAFEGGGISHAGTRIASSWNGQVVGAPGTWDGLPSEPDQIMVAPGPDGLQVTASACMIDVRAEALLTVYAEVPDPAPTPLELEVRRGEGSPIVDIASPPTGGWTLRVRASFPTVAGSEAWSETLFRVSSRFVAPGLTLGPEFFEIMAEARCPSYQLASGASASDECGSAYELMEGRGPVPVRPGAPLEIMLTDDWQIDTAMIRAVEARLVEAGEFAPEYSVDFQEAVGSRLSVPVALDPGTWILRISLTGTRQGDTFSAHYDLAVEIGDAETVETD